jgi:predicted alpha/beta hydrolase family esterase
MGEGPSSEGPPEGRTPLQALAVLAAQEVAVTRGLRHLELFTMGGLLTLLWHHAPDAGESAAPTAPATTPATAAVVACGGAMGGLLGPAEGLYHRLGVHLGERDVPLVRVSYRRPNDLDACCLDVAAAVQLLADEGARRVVVMGHSFGGAVAVRVAVALPSTVAGVVTFATQSAGCEVAGGLGDRPLLLFHGERDELLPIQASQVVRAMAGHGELVAIPGDGHLLAKSGPILWERLLEWLPDVLERDLPP